MHNLLSRNEAIEHGLKRYFTGKPCSKGHVCDRFVSQHRCVECSKEALRARGCKNAAYQKAWRSANIETSRARDRARYAADPQKRRATVYNWRAANPDYGPMYLEGWHTANPLKSREYTNRRRARKLAAEGSHTAADIARIFQDQRGRCAHPWCRTKLADYHIDHIIALSCEGSNWPSNLQLLCKPCNRRKSAKDPIIHAQENGMLL